MANPKTFTKQAINTTSDQDALQIKDVTGTVVGWIDSSGTGQGNLASVGGGGTPANPSTSVQFNNSGSFGGDSNLEWDNTNKQLSIGGVSSTTSGALTIIGAAVGNAASPIEIHSSFANGLLAYTHSSTSFRAPSASFSKSRGTQASPTNVLSGDSLGFWTFSGYDGSAYGIGAQITAQVGSAWNTGNHNCTLIINTTPSNSTTVTEAMRIGSNSNNGGDVDGNISRFNFYVQNTKVLAFLNGDTTPQAGLSQTAIGVVSVGNGTQGDTSGTIKAAAHSTGTAQWTSGNGSPEGAVTAVVGSLYTRLDGGANTTLYVKESGASNTGWIAK